MAGFTIIHLSDLHIGDKTSDEHLLALADFNAESLIDDFQEVTKEHSISFRPEETLLVITGDITVQAKWEEYEIATYFIHKLQSQFAQYLQVGELPPEHIICIPGNHDIEIPENQPGDTATQRKIKYRNFKLFLDEITDHSSFARDFTLANPFVNVHIPAPFRMQILDLNTALNVSCYSKEEASSKAVFTHEHLKSLEPLLKTQGDVFRIALMHHPVADFPSEDSDNRVSQGNLRDWLISKDFKIVLCGHAHSAAGMRLIPVLEENGLLELGTGYSFLLAKPVEQGNHYQIIRIEPSDDSRISLVRRRYVYAQEPRLLDRKVGHWEPEDLHHEVARPKVSKLMDIMGATDYKSFVGIRSPMDWTVVAHCESSKFEKFGVLSPGEQVNANLLRMSGYIEGNLERVDESSEIEWDKYSGKSSLFLVDSPHYNPYVRSILKTYGTYLAGGIVQFIDSRSETPVKQRIQINRKTLTANRPEGMRKPFGEFRDYLLVMRLPGLVPRTGQTTVEIPDIDKNRVIWVVAGIHSKASYAGAMLFTPRNLQLFMASLRKECGGRLPEYFEAVYKIPDMPERIENFNSLDPVHFKTLRLKSEIGLADDLPSGVAVRFLKKGYWNEIPISTVHLDPVAACNFNCPRCIEKDVRRRKLFLSMSTCVGILCDLRESGCQNLNFYGGEPTLHPDFDRILTLSSNLGFDMLLVTNGSRLGEKRIADAIVNSRNRIRIRVSIDADSEESHRRNHGLERNHHFDTIVTATEQLIKQGVSVTISFLLHKETIGEIEQACNFWREKRAFALILRPLTEEHGTSPELGYTQDERNAISRAINEHEGFVFAPAWFQNWINENRLPTEQQKQYQTCYSGYYRVAISPYEEATRRNRKTTVDGVEMTETSNAWLSLCTYRRYDPHYGCEYPQNIRAWCQNDRQKILERIDPPVNCKEIICCRHTHNEQIHDILSAS